nr:MAG TPA: hypothetical protein [Caudoviricetes sp.]
MRCSRCNKYTPFKMKNFYFALTVKLGIGMTNFKKQVQGWCWLGNGLR